MTVAEEKVRKRQRERGKEWQRAHGERESNGAKAEEGWDIRWEVAPENWTEADLERRHLGGLTESPWRNVAYRCRSPRFPFDSESAYLPTGIYVMSCNKMINTLHSSLIDVGRISMKHSNIGKLILHVTFFYDFAEMSIIRFMFNKSVYLYGLSNQEEWRRNCFIHFFPPLECFVSIVKYFSDLEMFHIFTANDKLWMKTPLK